MLINKIYVKKFGGYKIYSDICRGEEYFLSKNLIYFNNQHFVFIKKIYIFTLLKRNILVMEEDLILLSFWTNSINPELWYEVDSNGKMFA